MRFSHTSEQLAVAEAVGRCIDGILPDWPDERWQDCEDLTSGMLQGLADLGLPGLMVAADLGGSGFGAIEGTIAARESGRRLCPYPVVETMVACQAMAKAMPETLGGVLAGETIATLAWQGRRTGDADDGSGGPVVLEAVPYGQMARWLVAPSDILGFQRGCVVIDLQAQGVTVTPLRSFDLTSALTDVTIQDIDRAVVARGLDDGGELARISSLLYAADIVGVADACLGRSLAYLHDRQQFGRAIGHWQSLRHMAADDHVRLENSRLALDYAAWAVASGACDACGAVSVAKAYASRAARAIAQNSIQVHGGMGFTWDFPAHVALRRILRIGGTQKTETELIEELVANELIPRASAGFSFQSVDLPD